MPEFAKFAAALVATVQSGIENAFPKKQTTPVPNIAYPGDNCCTFYKDPDYRGASLTLCHDGVNAIEFDLIALDFNDTISSNMCGNSVAYDFCNDYSYSDCSQDHGNHGAGATRSPWVGHDDSLTTVKM